MFVNEQALLPVGSDTLRVRSLRRDLESTLTRLDEAIRTYSRPVVYVKDKDPEREKEEEKKH